MANSVIHFEIPADDIGRAKQFYSDVFGWQIQAYPGMDYQGVTTAEVDEAMMPKERGAINGGMFDRASFPLTNPVLTISVDDIDAALAQIEKAGGKTLMARQAVAEMGFTGYFTDPEGNVMGLWQNA
jgi:predicted enzyme related to lactoylglutathione lyase